jgi:hypothetical protein
LTRTFHSRSSAWARKAVVELRRVERGRIEERMRAQDAALGQLVGAIGRFDQSAGGAFGASRHIVPRGKRM